MRGILFQYRAGLPDDSGITDAATLEALL